MQAEQQPDRRRGLWTALRPLGPRACWRAVVRQPATSALIAATVAVGVGGILVVLAVADSVFARPLPYRADDELFLVFSSLPEQGRSHRATAFPDFVDWRQAARSAELEAVSSPRSFTLTGVDRPRALSGEYVSAGYLRLLGLDATAGRLFTEDDDAVGAALTTVLSTSFAGEQFGSAEAALGRTLRLADQPFEVVGVLEPAYRGILWDPVDLWVPLRSAARVLGDAYLDDRAMGWHLVVGRLRPGASLERARAELDDLAVRLEGLHPGSNQGRRNHVEPLRSFYFGDELRRGLVYLLGASLLVLLLIVANLMTLALALGTDNRREVAIRTALGAHRGEIWTTLAAPLAAPLAAGLALALALAWWLTPRLISLSDIPPASSTLQWVDGRIALAGVALVTLVATVVVALCQRGLARSSTSDVLRAGRSDRGRQRSLHRLVLLETTLAVVLLMGAGLLLRSLSGLRAQDPGFDVARLGALELDLQPDRYDDPAARVRFVRALLEQGREGGAAVAVAGPRLPPTANRSATLVPVGGDQERDGLSVYRHAISANLPETLGVELLAGRPFDGRDHAAAPRVALVSATVAERLGGDAVGRRFRLRPELDGDPDWTVVGIVEDIAARDVAVEGSGEPDVYLPYEQAPERSLFVVARGAADELAPLHRLRALGQRIRDLDGDLAIPPPETMAQRYALLTADETFRATVAGAFSVLAWGLAVLGLFGVLDLSVRSRRRDLAIRLALGATRGELMRAVFLQALRLAALGLLAGLALTLLLRRALSGLLFGVAPHDPTIVAWVTAVVVTTAVVAAVVPARRTLRIDATAELTRAE